MFSNLPSKLRNKDGQIIDKSLKLTQVRPKASTSRAAKKIHVWNQQIWINESQYFEGISENIWQTYIGGYRPAKRWIEERKNHILTQEDISHYSKIIKALEETDRIMKEIDRINFI